MVEQMQRCDVCGPYSAEQAALIVLGRWTPPRSGYRCPVCTEGIKVAAQRLANAIDAQAVEEAYRSTVQVDDDV